MKKHTWTLAVTAILLCLGAVTLNACTDSTGNPAEDTGRESVTESATESESAPESESALESDADTEVSGESESNPESDTETEPESDTAPVETEAVTAPPRYDYFEAEVLPQVTVQAENYTNMSLTLPAELKITDADVQDYIEYIRFQYRVASNGDSQVTDQALKLGDDAYIYYKGMIDGVEFEGGSNWNSEQPYTLGLGSGTFIPGFEEGLVGVVPNTTSKEAPFELHVTFPENYSADVAGKDAVFYVVVEYAVQYDLLTYDRSFVENTLKYEPQKEFYASDRALLDEFEEYILSYLQADIADTVESAKIDALWTYLTDAIDCRELPQLELDYYYNNYVSEIEYIYEYYAYYYGESFLTDYPTLDDYARYYTGVAADEDWREVLRDRATRLVKKDMISHAIAEIEGIELLTDEEYREELEYWMDQYYMTEEELLAYMGEITLRESAFSVKMQEWLLARAEFSYAADDETV